MKNQYYYAFYLENFLPFHQYSSQKYHNHNILISNNYFLMIQISLNLNCILNLYLYKFRAFILFIFHLKFQYTHIFIINNLKKKIKK
jgi:hypothetical protein